MYKFLFYLLPYLVKPSHVKYEVTIIKKNFLWQIHKSIRIKIFVNYKSYFQWKLCQDYVSWFLWPIEFFFSFWKHSIYKKIGLPNENFLQDETDFDDLLYISMKFRQWKILCSFYRQCTKKSKFIGSILYAETRKLCLFFAR